MIYLSAVTLLWAFSFSLIGVYLAGQVDSWFSVLMRVALASVVFLPFLKFKGISKRLIGKLMVVGGFQLGLMYCFYYQSFLLLSVPEVLLFTVFTPIYVTLIYDLLNGRFSPWYLVTAIIAVLGAVFIKFATVNPNFLLGFLVVQGANLCFAIGQVGYKYIMEREPIELPQHTVFGYFSPWRTLCRLGRVCFDGQSEQATDHTTAMGHFNLPRTDCIWLGLFCLEQRRDLGQCGCLSGHEQRVGACGAYRQHRDLESRCRFAAPNLRWRSHSVFAVAQ